jgi:hypothetical protein
MPEIAPRAERSDSRTFRAGWVLLAFIVGTVALLPELWPRSPDRQLDPAAAGLARPGSRFDIVPLADGRTLAAVAIEVTSSEVVLHGQPRPTRVALGDLAGAMDSQTFPLGSDEFGRDVRPRARRWASRSPSPADRVADLSGRGPPGRALRQRPAGGRPRRLADARSAAGISTALLLLDLAAIAAGRSRSSSSSASPDGFDGPWCAGCAPARPQFVAARAAAQAGSSSTTCPNALAALSKPRRRTRRSSTKQRLVSRIRSTAVASWETSRRAFHASAGWWVAFFPARPGMTAIAFNLVGEAARQLDPRARVPALKVAPPPRIRRRRSRRGLLMLVGDFDFGLPASATLESHPRQQPAARPRRGGSRAPA